MSRASVASLSVRVMARGLYAQLRTARDHLTAEQWELGVRRAVIGTLVVFIVLLVATAWSFSVNEQNNAIEAATREMELVAAVMADDINIHVTERPNLSAAQALARAVPSCVTDREQRILLSDATGRIIASYPEGVASGTMLDHLGTSEPLAILADKAGVMRVNLAGQEEVLATVKALNAPLGQIAIIHPMVHVLGSWHAALLRMIVLLCCTAGVLLALAGAYFWQASRARHRRPAVQPGGATASTRR